MKQQGLPDYYRQKLNAQQMLEKQLREELLKLDEKKPAADPNTAFREEIQALLQRYEFSLDDMSAILGLTGTPPSQT